MRMFDRLIDWWLQGMAAVKFFGTLFILLVPGVVIIMTPIADTVSLVLAGIYGLCLAMLFVWLSQIVKARAEADRLANLQAWKEAQP